jgi:hypothetical protein
MTIEMVVARVEALEKQIALILKQGTSDAEPTKSKKAKKEDTKSKKTKKTNDDTSSDDEDKPKKKRGTTGYILFSKSVRDGVIAKLNVGDDKPKNTEIMKQQAALWAELGDTEKAVWNTKAKEANAAVAE